MGKKETIKKVVLDTNVLVSALLFHGELSNMVDLWKEGKIIPVISKETFDDFKRVITYPKFSLTGDEVSAVIKENILPFFEVVDAPAGSGGICRDPDDEKFLSCALAASADFIVSGDKDLCDMERFKSIRIIKAADFIRLFDGLN